MLRSRPVILLLTAILLALFVIAPLAAADPVAGGATLAVLAPPVTVTPAAGTPRPATAGESLAPGAGVNTGQSGGAELGFPAGTSLRLDMGSAARLEQPAAQPDGSTLPVSALDGGVAEAQAPPGATGFLLHTPGAEVRVLNARLRARVLRDPATGLVIQEEIAVEVGTAEVRVGDQVVTVQAGQVLRILPPGADGVRPFVVEPGAIPTSWDTAAGAAQREQPDHDNGDGGNDSQGGDQAPTSTPAPSATPTAAPSATPTLTPTPPTPTPSPTPPTPTPTLPPCPAHPEDPRAVCWVGGSGDWSDLSHWSTGTVPGPDANVYIQAGGVTVTHAAGTDRIATLHASDGLRFTGGSLELNAADGESKVGNLEQGAGSITTRGTLTLDGTWYMGGLLLMDGGRLVIAPDAILRLASTSSIARGPSNEVPTIENRGSLLTGGSVAARVINITGVVYIGMHTIMTEEYVTKSLTLVFPRQYGGFGGTLVVPKIDMRGGQVVLEGTIKGDVVNAGDLVLDAYPVGPAGRIETVGKIEGDYKQTDDGTLTIDTSISRNCRTGATLVVNGEADLGGHMRFLELGCGLEVGDRFAAVTYRSHSGSFDLIPEGFTADYGDHEVTITRQEPSLAAPAATPTPMLRPAMTATLASAATTPVDTATPQPASAATPTAALATTVPTAEPSPTNEATATDGVTAEPTATATPEPSATAEPSPTPGAADEPSPTATSAATPTPEVTATAEATDTPIASPTATATRAGTPTATREPTSTATPEPTAPVEG